MLVAGKGLGEDATNGAAARPVVTGSPPPPGKGEQGRRESERSEWFKKQREEINVRP